MEIWQQKVLSHPGVAESAAQGFVQVGRWSDNPCVTLKRHGQWQWKSCPAAAAGASGVCGRGESCDRESCAAGRGDTLVVKTACAGDAVLLVLNKVFSGISKLEETHEVLYAL